MLLTTKNNFKTQKPEKIYMDFQATTPIDPRVLDAMLPYATSIYGNPHSRTHSFGWDSEYGLEKSREKIASLIGAEPKEIIFTSGATESNNLAIQGIAKQYDNKLHIITSKIEHKCVLSTCRELENMGVEVTYLPVNKDGHIDLKELEDSIRPNTKLVSIMAVNNEIGTINDLAGIGDICKKNNIVFHTDAAQAFGKIQIDVKKYNIGLMSISGHKIYGPKGIGALYVRNSPKVRIKPMIFGGGQERGMRSGTMPTFLAVGLGKASEIAREEMKKDEDRLEKYRALFIKKLSGYLPKDSFIINGKKTIPGCLNISFPYVEGESLLMSLENVALSSGSACTSSSLEPSYVLRSIGASDELAHSSIRFGFGRFTRKEEVLNVAKKTSKAVKKLLDLSPLYEMVKKGIDLKSIDWKS